MCKWPAQSKLVIHDATHHYFKLNGKTWREKISLQGVPCDAAMFEWPNTKGAWCGGSCWLIRLCENCARREGIEW